MGKVIPLSRVLKKSPFREEAMDFDYTDHEYLPQCTDGCGAITGWLHSRMVAGEAGINHEKSKGHSWIVRERLK